MKFVIFSEKFIRKSNDRILDEFAMVFEEPLQKKDLEEPMTHEYQGNYVRLTLLENDQLSFGSVFDEPEDDTIFINRKKLISLLDQLDYMMKNNLRPLYLIKDEKQFEFTNQFPTKYALFIKKNEAYNLIECNDLDLKLLALFLSNYKESNNYKKFLLEDKKNFIGKIDWKMDNLKIKPFGNKILLLDEKNREIKIDIEYLTMLMNQWSDCLDKDPEKIYLLLENGEYRLTTQYSLE